MTNNRLTRIIIAGSRSIKDYRRTESAMDQFTAGAARRGRFEIVSGGADGVDQHAKRWAEEYDCEYTEFLPEWDVAGRAAGPQRNAEMAEYADALVAVWDGKSAGTRNMIEQALDCGLDIYVSVNDD